MITNEYTYNEILSKIQPAPPETGGILGSVDGVVTRFVFDKGLVQAPCCYVPDVDMLNSVIKKWQEEDIDFCGIVHSHMPYEKELSEGDKEYITKILHCMPREYNSLYFPLIVGNKMVAYKATVSVDGLIISQEEIILEKGETKDEKNRS